MSLVEGKRGEYTVWVGDTLVAKKDSKGFPPEQDVVTKVQDALKT